MFNSRPMIPSLLKTATRQKLSHSTRVDMRRIDNSLSSNGDDLKDLFLSNKDKKDIADLFENGEHSANARLGRVQLQIGEKNKSLFIFQQKNEHNHTLDVSHINTEHMILKTNAYKIEMPTEGSVVCKRIVTFSKNSLVLAKEKSLFSTGEEINFAYYRDFLADTGWQEFAKLTKAGTVRRTFWKPYCGNKTLSHMIITPLKPYLQEKMYVEFLKQGIFFIIKQDFKNCSLLPQHAFVHDKTQDLTFNDCGVESYLEHSFAKGLPMQFSEKVKYMSAPENKHIKFLSLMISCFVFITSSMASDDKHTLETKLTDFKKSLHNELRVLCILYPHIIRTQHKEMLEKAFQALKV